MGILRNITLKIYDITSKIFVKIGFGKNRFMLSNATKIRTKIVPKSVTIDDFLLYLDSMDSLGLSIKGEKFERKEVNIVKKLVRNGNIVLDLGAHIGYYSLLFSKMVGNKGQVFSFEPVPENFRLLRKNIEQNNCTNIILEQKAVLDTSKEIKLYLSTQNAADNRIAPIEKNSKSIKTKCTSLDEYFVNFNKQIDFIKMDVQGSELAILKGMKNTIQKNKNLIIMTEFDPYLISEAGHNPREFLEEIRNNGFKLFDIEKNTEVPTDILTLLTEYSQENKSTNLLCIK